MNNIDYLKILNALDYYKNNGFEYVHLDWLVEEKISCMTKPEFCKDFFVKDKVLVASGEQSFLQLIVDNKLPKGRYVGVTPCFRDEVTLDLLHGQYFMKVELIDTLDVSVNSLCQILDISLNFFNQYLKCESWIIDTVTFDIIDSKNHIELGSYGIRQHDNIKWIYATGCAEPRLSNTINLQ
jgi:seryl-tRNA synthetase